MFEKAGNARKFLTFLFFFNRVIAAYPAQNFCSKPPYHPQGVSTGMILHRRMSVRELLGLNTGKAMVGGCSWLC